MATIYKINIKTVSAFQNYPVDKVREIFEDFIKEYRDKKTGLGFESTVVDVKKE